MKKIIIFFLFYPIFIQGIIQYSSVELEWLKKNNKVDVMLSTSNYPYEYIENGKFAGLNVDILKALEKELDIEIHFHTVMNNTSNPTLYSKYFKQKDNDLVRTKPIYFTEFTIIKKKNEIKSEDVIVAGQYYAFLVASKIINSNNIQYYKSLNDAIWQFVSQPNVTMIIDNNHWKKFKEITTENNIPFDPRTKNITEEFTFYIPKKQLVFQNILNKGITNLEYNGQIQKLFRKNKKKFDESKNAFLTPRERIFLYIFFLCIMMILFFIVFKIIKKTKKIECDINACFKENKTLKKRQKNLQKMIKTSEQKNVEVLESLDSVVMIYTSDGFITYVNKQVQKRLGYAPEMLIGSKLYDVFDSAISKKMLSVLYNEKELSTEIVLNTKDGIQKNFLYSLHINSETEKDYSITCYLQDITARKSLEKRLEAYATHLEDLVKQRTEKLRVSEEQFRLLVEKVQDCIFLLQDQKFLFVNQKFIDLLGYKNTELMEGKISFNQIIAEESILFVSEKQKEFYDKNLDNIMFEFDMKKADGTKLTVEINMTSILFNDAESELGIIRDVTEKKREEEKKLQEERLMIATQLAVTANDRINSPLNTISGYIEMLEMKLGTENKFYNRAFSNTKKSVRIIEEIMQKLKSLNEVILKDYKVKDTKMLNLDDVDVQSLTKDIRSQEDYYE